MLPEIQLDDCWAKTFPKGHPHEGHPALTVRDHCLIVGSVAAATLKLLPPASLHLPPSGTATLTAAHDIGKITPGFLRKCVHSFAHRIPGSQHCEPNHALVSQAFLASLQEMQDERGQPLAWALAAGGHHGSYPGRKVRNTLGKRSGPAELEFSWPNALRHELLTELLDRFGPLPDEEVPVGSRLHWLTGFVTFCDWIGSNTDWFKLPSTSPLQDSVTPESAKQDAKDALNRIGWHRRSVTPHLSFSKLFASESHQTFHPRPLQETLIQLADAPALYIVEAPMGMGKTEAALAAAYRRWTEGTERGLYFALPTQLTSNRIHQRTTEFLDNIIADETIQILAHGNAWLREDRARSFSPSCTIPETTGQDAHEACRWFSSNRKPLLAPFGTGTIDQALMAAIGAKHSALRLFALSGKVVVIDEVHSYDPYTSALVDHLILWLREVGCTVIVLSATLTAKRRREMIEKVGAAEASPPPEAYPLITKVLGNTASHHPVDDPNIRETPVHITHLDADSPDIIAKAARAAENGACVLMVRNTVALAQQSYRSVKAALKDDTIPVGLLHSRFPHCQREINEARWMDLLGANPSERPDGCVLVATQVVEQSVDIDADLLITDLAPTDLLLQRLGRLHRHQRHRPKGFEEARCWILQPEVNWHAEPKAIRDAIGPSAFVYPPISLYAAQQIWRPRNRITLPSEIRTVLESSTSLPAPLPEGAAALAEEMENTTSQMLEKAIRQGPFIQAYLPDTEGVQTRYNIQPSAMLILLREEPRQHGSSTNIHPFCGDPQEIVNGLFNYELAKSLHQSAARVPAYLVRKAMDNQPPWLSDHISNAVIAICREDSTKLEILGGEDLNHHISHHPDQGISYEKKDTLSRSYDEPDEYDSWY